MLPARTHGKIALLELGVSFKCHAQLVDKHLAQMLILLHGGIAVAKGNGTTHGSCVGRLIEQIITEQSLKRMARVGMAGRQSSRMGNGGTSWLCAAAAS